MTAPDLDPWGPLPAAPTTPDVLAIAGSTQFTHPAGLGRALKVIEFVLDTQPPAMVVVETLHGHALSGVAALAEQAARSRGIPVKYANAHHKQMGGRGGIQARRHNLVDQCTRLLDIKCAHDSRKTGYYTAWLAEKGGKPVERIPIGA